MIKLLPRIIIIILLLVLGYGLGMRLLVWQWREFYPLGGDETEYFEQALTLLREHRYDELRFMRPPLYTFFLAASICLFDSLVQQLRLVQILLSVGTMVPLWLLTRELQRGHGSLHGYAAPLVAVLLWGSNYTLAFYATHLLSETLFLFLQTTFFWLLFWGARVTSPHTQRIILIVAGLTLGMLCLTRSLAVILLALSFAWLTLHMWFVHGRRRCLWQGLVVVGSALLIILPWTLRNMLTYGAPILIDTTGAENLWLDNDPAGRDTVKAQLYAMGDDRAARQQLAMERGVAVIVAHPDHFLAKMGRELQAFFALEHTDDMRQRPVIWVSPLEVWLRLIMGDGLWLLILIVGGIGIMTCRREISSSGRWHIIGWFATPEALHIIWSCYILLTLLIFHVELRYRLPLYPVLIPYAAFVLVSPARLQLRHPAPWFALITLLFTVAYAPYPVLAWHLGWKHMHLARATAAFERGDLATAHTAVSAALVHDPESVRAHVLLASIGLREGDEARARELLDETIARAPAHPHAHILRGDLLRRDGHMDAARIDLAYETASLEDLQLWSWHNRTTPLTSTLHIGNGLDLGFIHGFHAAEPIDGESLHGRWTTDAAQICLAPPLSGGHLQLQLSSGRPTTMPMPQLSVGVGGEIIGQFHVASEWRTYHLPLPSGCRGLGDSDSGMCCMIELQSETFTPRDHDPASDDGRTLGVLVHKASLAR